MPGNRGAEHRLVAPGLQYLGQRYLLPALLLSLCIIPFGLTGAAAPAIWLALCTIETQGGWKRAAAFLVSGLLMLVTALGILPGSERVELLPPYSDASGNTIYASFNAGKAVIAIAVVAFMLRQRGWLHHGDLLYISAAIALPFLLGLMATGLSPKFGAAIVVAATVNLLVVCISEEGFFRWILQRGSEELLGSQRWLAVLLVTAIFTLLHTGWAASPLALVLVTAAGACYSLLWYLRRNFWACVLAHWGVNVLHLFLLPYPLPG
ncbi:CPBP family intramembrane glutamic endopeptidase [Microbulbifer taiwanensis]|uniref:CPBP family intramembrane glutamic endopeptidase n=1 Tax=Microbulbifer taiwanensis TaxID=986746 RepID=A0ABW1YN33_9GAMM|nr:CPBP family intramembrane glutamic endopeptidase [Microbulbifer taiwanensis]